MGSYSNAAISLALAVIILTTLIWFLRKRHHIPRTRKSIILNGRQDGVLRIEELMERQLGPMETTFYKLQKRGMELVSNVFVISSKIPCSQQLLGLAVALLAERHPLLRMRIVNRNDEVFENPTLFFEETEYLRVDMDVDRVTTSWRDKLETELLKTLPDGGPLWRATYLPKATKEYSDEVRQYQHCFVFSFHHAIIDGTALPKLMAEFLEFVEQLHERFDEEFEMTSLPLPPTAEEVASYITKRQTSWFHSACMRVLSFEPVAAVSLRLATSFIGRNKWMAKPRRKLCKSCPLQVKKTTIVPTILAETDTNMLIHRCGKESVTFLCAFTAATALAWREMLQKDLPEDQQAAAIKIQINFTVDLRRRFLLCQNVDNGGSHDPNMANHVASLFASLPTAVSVNEPTEEHDFWDLAREYKSSIHTDMDHRISESLSKYELYNKVLTSDSFNLFEEDEGRFPTDMTNNNFGKIKELNRSEDSSFKVAALFVCTAGHNMGTTLHNSLATFDNKLFWTMSYFTNVMCQKDAEEFVSKTKRILIHAIEM